MSFRVCCVPVKILVTTLFLCVIGVNVNAVDAVLVARPSSGYNLLASGATGGIAFTKYVPLRHLLEEDIQSIAVDGNNIWFTSWDRQEYFIPTGEGQLYHSSLGSSEVTEIAADIGASKVIAIDQNPYLVQIDRTTQALTISELMGNTANTVFSADLSSTFRTNSNFSAGFDRLTNEVLISYTSRQSFASDQQILAVSATDWLSQRTATAEMSSFSPFDNFQIIVDADQSRAYLKSDYFGGTSSVDLPTLAVLDEIAPSYTDYFPSPFGQPSSDVFQYAYGSDMPSAVEVRIASREDVPSLFRGATFTSQFDVNLTNWIAPDDVTQIDSVEVDSFFASGLPEGTTLDTQTTVSGGLAERSLGVYQLTFDATGLEQGRYSLLPDLSLAGDYLVEGETSRRELITTSLASNGSFVVAVDPFDGNYVGNGDFALDLSGWGARGGNGFRESIRTDPEGNTFISITHSGGVIDGVLEGDLQLGVPEEGFVFSFDYRVTRGDVDDIFQTFGVTIAGLVDGESARFNILRLDGLGVTDGWEHIEVEVLDVPEGLTDTSLSIGFHQGLLPSDFVLDIDNILLTALETTVSLAGDYNGNGVVDAADYTVWQDNFGSTTNLAADGNGNGIIDAADYTVWQDNFGATSAAALGLANIPEPGTLALLSFGLPALMRRRAAVR